jgi:aryl-alcohol dehydrogenase-like predicted oxidoreductase
MSLKQYVTLGRSGLRVSPLALGTMTFGTEWGWGSEPAVAHQVFDRYIEQGGNFIDTADGYTMGKCLPQSLLLTATPLIRMRGETAARIYIVLWKDRFGA